MGRRVHILEVADPAMWQEVEALVDLAPLIEAVLGPRRRAVRRGSERAILPALRGRGLDVILRDLPEPPRPSVDLGPTLGRLSGRASVLLHTAQRRAIRGTLLGARAWHPVLDGQTIEELAASGLITPLDPDNPSPLAAWTLHAELPPPPEPDWDFDEALFDPPDDLDTPDVGLSRLLEDAAILAAALRHVAVRRTHMGHLDRAACRRLGTRLHDAGMKQTGDLDRSDPRWRRALDLLLGLEAIVEDTIERTLRIREHLVVHALAGSASERIDRAVRRITPPELHALLVPLRIALLQAGEQAIDDVVLLELMSEQQDGTFAADPDAFLAQERPLLAHLLVVLSAFGLVRRAPGAFAATADGLAWAGCPAAPAAQVWVSSDLEVLIPPGALGPLDRYRIERLTRPVARDVVDRLKLTREGVADWLTDGEVEGCLALLGRIAPAVPPSVDDTLRAWSAGLSRVVLVRDVVLER